MKVKRLYLLPLFSLLLTSCFNSGSSSSKPQKQVVNYYETEQGVYKAKSIFNYKSIQNNSIYRLSYSPSTGDSNLLIIPIWFNDSSDYIATSKKESIRNDIRLAYFGNEEETGWESVSSYYKKDSYNKLNLIGEVTPWYEINRSSTEFYEESSGGKLTNQLVSDAVNWYKGISGKQNLLDFDKDHDGYLDGVMLIYGSPNYRSLDIINAGNMWAYAFWLQDPYKKNVDNPGPNAFFWASYDYMYSKGIDALERTGKTNYGYGDSTYCKIDAHTYIHEMGHILGLVDYYDYSDETSPGGLFSMQDGNMGDHDPFSKLALGWVDPYIPLTNKTFTIKNLTEYGELVLLKPNSLYTSPFDEYILLELYSPNGLNKFDVDHAYLDNDKGPSGVGVRVWHVDARLFSITATDPFGNPTKGYITNNPEYGRIMSATSNSTSGTQAVSWAGSFYYNTLQLIRRSKIMDYKTKSVLSSSDLFKKGDTFSLADYSSQFVNGSIGKLNNGASFNWKIAFDQISLTEMTITLIV